MPRGALEWIPAELAVLEARGLRRSLEPLWSQPGPVVEVGGRRLVNLCSSDYLGLAADPRLKRAAVEALEREGAGAGATRLRAGDLPIHGELERRLARLKGTEAALLFSSGYHASAGVLGALVGQGDALFSDEWNQAAIIDGGQPSRAEVQRYPHRDVDGLGRLLAASRSRRKLVATDAVFGMDGDAAPLPEIVALCQRHGAMLYLDEAHATGVLGERGAGLAEATGLAEQVDVIMGTMGKALASFGAFAAASRPLIDRLTSRAQTFACTTALPPAACSAALAALDILEGDLPRRRRLRDRTVQMRDGLEWLGFPVQGVVAPIFPVILGDEAAALEASRRLRERGFLARAVRPPTVPRGTSRLRVSLTAGHTAEQVDGFLAALKDVLGEVGWEPGRRAGP